MRKAKGKKTNQFRQPVDKISIVLISILTVIIALLVLVVTPVGPKVRDFSWQDQKIGATDRAFILTFNSPMDRESVENNLKIEPALPGKISWSGRRLAYTLDHPATYGIDDYKITIKGARDKIGGKDSQGKLLQPFTGNFRSKNRAFAYIGVEGEEKGKLVLYNLTGRKQSVITPADLVVTDFQPYPQGDRILFAAEEQKDWSKGLNKQQLYSVATGIPSQEGEELAPGENLQVVLDSKDYQNLEFEIAQDGETIVVKRISWRNKNDQDLWVIKGEEAKPLKQELTGYFVITPDSQGIVTATGKDGKGVGVVPLEPETETIEFLPKFGQVLSFASDGTAAAMVDFNSDDPKLRYARSLFLVTNQGVQKKLLDVKGSLVDCAFNANRKNLYCLLSELKEEAGYEEQPYLAKFDLEDTEKPTVTPLALLPEQLDVKMSLAPDGLGILVDQVIPTETDSPEALRSDSGQPIATSRLWLLLLPTPGTESPEPPALEELPLPGFKPQWMP